MSFRWLYIIWFALFFSACQGGNIAPDWSSSVVIIRGQNHAPLGMGGVVSPDRILTAGHITKSCSDGCFIDGEKIGDIQHVEGKDIAYIHLARKGAKNNIQQAEKIFLGMPVYAIVFSGSSSLRLFGEITRIGVDYIGYSPNSLSGQLFTGAIETNIVFSPGASGTPLWTVSGGLIGVVSATDRASQRSYIAR